MQLAKFQTGMDAAPRVGIVEGDRLRPLAPGVRLADLLHAPDPRAAAIERIDPRAAEVALHAVRLRAPQRRWRRCRHRSSR